MCRGAATSASQTPSGYGCLCMPSASIPQLASLASLTAHIVRGSVDCNAVATADPTPKLLHCGMFTCPHFSSLYTFRSPAAQLANSLRATAYPFVGLLAFSGSRVRLVLAITGLLGPAELVQALNDAAEAHGAEFVADRADASERVRSI